MNMVNDARSALYDRMYTHEHAELGTGPVSIEPYVSPEYFELEQRKVFDNAWLFLCAENEIPQPGDYIVKNVPLLKASLIIARGKDKVVRAFYNVCKHRGNELVYKECRGNKSSFTCRFHGWTFGLDGSLRGVTDADRFFDLDKSRLGLTPVKIDTWNGLIFVTRAVGDVKPLRDYLGLLADEMEGFPFDEKILAAEWKVDLKTNWKIMVDAFQEGYHLAFIHRNSVPTFFTGPDRPILRMSNYRVYGAHRAATVPRNPAFEPSPTEAMSFQLAGSAISPVSDTQESEVKRTGLNPCADPDYGYDLHVVFPSTIIYATHGFFFVYESWPVAVDQTHWVAKVYLPPPANWSERIGLEFMRIQIREGLMEDLTTVEATQRGLSTGAIASLVLSDQELAIRHNLAMVDKAVKG